MISIFKVKIMQFRDEILDYFDVEKFVLKIFGETQHAKRIRSIANAALGVIASTSLIVHRIGRGLARMLNLSDKHAVKQVDRLLSNKKLKIEDTDKNMVEFAIGNRKEVKITMDWTDFDLDSQATISLNLVTSHGRATPLLWKTIDKKELKDNRNNFEDQILLRLKHALPAGVKVTILADRGFFDIKLFEFLKKDLDFEYCIRVRNNIHISDFSGINKKASEWVPNNGKTKTLRKARITNVEYEVNLVAIKHQKGMKQPWCIASSDETLSGSGLITWYAKRWGCEPQFRDTKDIHFGMGLDATRIKNPDRRDRILLIGAIATILLTFLGAACEKIGLDKYLKVNTSKKRTLSLFKQGCIIFNRLEKMAIDTAEKLMNAFCELIIESKKMTAILSVI
jgi:hypothetical protein